MTWSKDQSLRLWDIEEGIIQRCKEKIPDKICIISGSNKLQSPEDFQADILKLNDLKTKENEGTQTFIFHKQKIHTYKKDILVNLLIEIFHIQKLGI